MTRCLSPYIRVTPGEHRLSASFQLPKLTEKRAFPGTPQQTPIRHVPLLSSAPVPSAVLLYYDSKKKPIRLTGLTRKSRIDLGEKTRAFRELNGSAPTHWIRLPLVAEYYPADTEFLPREVAFVRVGFEWIGSEPLF
ncbi:MAG: hypothetical protein ACRD1Z_11145, partial [Vicinamibacteria bacterium]